jgi:multidrug resistance efflux pump
VSQRNKFFGFLGLLLIIAAVYYFFSTDRSSDLVLVGTVDANQVVVSPKISGRIERLAVDEGTEVKAGDTIAVLDSQELTADRQAAEALLASLRHQVSQTRATEEQTAGETSSGVVNAQARLRAAQSTLVQAQADLTRIEGDTRRSVALAQQGIVSQQQADQATACSGRPVTRRAGRSGNSSGTHPPDAGSTKHRSIHAGAAVECQSPVGGSGGPARLYQSHSSGERHRYGSGRARRRGSKPGPGDRDHH